MAFELGGRADKFGNRYERRYFVSLMAKVLQGGLLSVQSEPTGDDESGTDIIVEYQGGRKDFHQCKARNGSNEHWTTSALARHKVFQHIKEHVKTEQNHFVFVTALPFVALNDLCLAARNSDSCQRFVTDQLTTHDRKNLFDQWRKNLGLGETAADQEQSAFYLRQFEICTLSDDSVEGDQWKYVLGSMFTGNPDDVYDVLLNLTENDNYGKTLTAGIPAPASGLRYQYPTADRASESSVQVPLPPHRRSSFPHTGSSHGVADHSGRQKCFAPWRCRHRQKWLCASIVG